MAKLALKGGIPIRNPQTHPWPRWPVWTEADEQALLQVLHSGIWSYNGSKELAFNQAFANFIGVRHALAAVNGTVTLQLALEALGIGLGDEVIVPGLTWQATAAAVLDVNAAPVLVDVRQDTWCLDPQQVTAAISDRTRAIIPVHLYGHLADMDAITQIAQKHGLKVIEDCAHMHGGEWRGKKAGSIGDIGSFSFQMSKVMTAGEGGALTTNDPGLFGKLDALRNCGRRPVALDSAAKAAGDYGEEGDFIQSGNYRITEFQAALLLEGLHRLPGQNNTRAQNAAHFNALLQQLPGVQPLARDERMTRPVYYMFCFRYDRQAFKGVPAARFRQALAKEIGTAVHPSYQPLADCTLYRPHTKPARHRLNEAYWQELNPSRFALPVSEKIYREQSICLHHSALLGSKADMDSIAEAIQKIYDHADELN